MTVKPLQAKAAGPTRLCSRRIARTGALLLGLMVGLASMAHAEPTACAAEVNAHLPAVQHALDTSRQKADAGQLVQSLLEFELLINQTAGWKAPFCEAQRDLLVDLFTSYAIALVATGQQALGEAVLDQLLAGDLTGGVPLRLGEVQRLAVFAKRAQLRLNNLQMVDQSQAEPSANANPSPGARDGVDGVFSFPELAGRPLQSDSPWGALLAVRYGRETNLNFAPNSSLLNLFSDIGPFQVDLGDAFRRKAGPLWLVDATVNYRTQPWFGRAWELGAYTRRRDTSINNADTTAEGAYAAILNPWGGNGAATPDKLTLNAEAKTIFGQRVHSRELAYERPLQWLGLSVEPQATYREIDYSLSINNARQVRVGGTLVPQHASLDSLWGLPLAYRAGLRLEYVEDRAVSPLRLGGHQTETTAGVFIQLRQGAWYGELSLNSGRRASEREYSALLQPGANLQIERLGWAATLKRSVASNTQGVLNFQHDVQRSNISVLETKNSSVYMGLEWRY